MLLAALTSRARMNALESPWRTILIAKALVGLAAVAALLGDFNALQFAHSFAHWPPGNTPVFSSHFSTWDAAHYFHLSREGYVPGSPSCAFYPLWPALLRLGSVITWGNPMLAGMLFANALSIVALGLFHELVKHRYGAAVARDALILMLAFPGALFFSFPYTESAFLVILMCFFWGLELRRWGWVAWSSFLLPLARPVGLLIAVPLAWHFLERYRACSGKESLATTRGSKQANDERPRRGLNPVFVLALPVAGYALYLGLMGAWTGNAFEGFDAQKVYPHSPSIRNMFDWKGLVASLLNVHSFDGMVDGGIDRISFLVVLALLPQVFKLNRTWFFYVLPAALLPVGTSWFMSYRRYTVVLFPVFVALAILLARANSRAVFWGYVVVFSVAQAAAIFQFTNFNWAG